MAQYFIKSRRGFTLVELMMVIVISSVVAALILPKFIDLTVNAKAASERAIVAAVRSGINFYKLKAVSENQATIYPTALDSAHDGNSTMDNSFFKVVVFPEIIDLWSKAGNYYKGPTGTVYYYNPVDGTFLSEYTIPGPLAAWYMEEDGGIGVADPYGHFDGTITGATWAAGKVGTALSFDGDFGHLHVPDSPDLNLSSQGSISAWIYMNSIPAFAGIVHKGDKADWSDETYTLQFWTGNTVILGLRDNGGNLFLVQTTNAFSTGQWYHVASTWDSSGMKVYVNGVLNNSNAAAVTVRSSAGGVNIGSQIEQPYSYDWRNLPFDGIIDQPTMYNRSLSPQEIQDYYNATK